MNVHKTFVITILISLCDFAFSQVSKELGDIDLGCPRGSYKFGDLCYSISTLSGRYAEGELSCEIGGGRLAIVNSPEIYLFLQKLRLYKYICYWFGLNDKSVEGTWHYSDGSRADGFFKWAPGEPNNFRNYQDCAKLEMAKDLLWDDNSCLNPWKYICQFEGDNCSNSSRPSLGLYCFEISKDVANYDHAEEQCQLKGGYLAKIKTTTTYEFIKGLIYSDRSVIENYESKTADLLRVYKRSLPPIWIGLTYHDGGWVYSDGSPVNDFSMWAPGEPNNQDKNEDCVCMGENWHDVPCDRRYIFVCQYNVSSIISSNSTANKIVGQSSGLHMSTSTFVLTLFMVFFTGVLVIPCIWGAIRFHRRNRKEGMRNQNNGDSVLHILNEEDSS